MDLTPREKALIVAAVSVCTASGGGSEMNSLAYKLSEGFGVERFCEEQIKTMLRLTDIVLDDAIDAGIINRIAETV